MVGKLDKEIIEKFKEFQEKTGKHSELYIEDVEFEEKTLNSICLITMGQSPKGEYLNKNGEGIPFYQGKTNYGDIYLDKPSTWTIKSKKEAKKNDILISLRAPAGSINIANIDLSIGRGLASIRCSDKVALFYLYYYLKNNEMKISNDNENGGFFSSMNKDYLYDISVPIPKDLNKFYSSYQIQEAIVEFLEYRFKEIERIKERIDKRYTLFKELEKWLIPSTFIKDYVKVAFGRYAKEFNINFNITDVEFEIKVLSKVSEITMGQSPKGDFLNSDKIGKAFFQGKTDFGKVFLNKPSRWTTDSKREAKKNDILISLRAPAGVVNITTMDISIGRGLASIRVFNEIENFYIFYFLKNNESKISSESENGGFFTSMNKDYLYNLKIPIPKDLKNYTSLEIQKIMANFIEFKSNQIQKEFDRMDKGYDNLRLLHKTYLARTFSLINWGAK